MLITGLTSAVTVRDLVTPYEVGPRSTDVPHISDVISEIMKSIDPDVYKTDTRDQALANNLMYVGHIWEQVFSAVLHAPLKDGRLLRGAELHCDGLCGTPDWLEAAEGDDPDLWSVETKATWKSAREWLDGPDGPRRALESAKFVAWKMQFLAYCKLIGTRRTKLHVLFINDDYKAFLPAVRSWAIEWTVREIDENWQVLRNRARKEGWLK